MRTTITLEPDVAAKLKRLARRRRASFNQTLNDVLRNGLNSQAGTREPPERFVVQAHTRGFRIVIDPDKLNQFLDDLEVADFIAESRPAKRSSATF